MAHKLSTLDQAWLDAAKTNDTQRLFACFTQGANTRATDKNGDNAAIWLARRGNGDAVIRLGTLAPKTLTQGNNYGWTAAILLAFQNRASHIFRLTLLNPKQLEHISFGGWSVAICLTFCDNISAVLKLAEIHPAVKQQTGVIEAAIYQKHPEMIAAFIKAGYAQPHDINERLEDVGLSWDDISS